MSRTQFVKTKKRIDRKEQYESFIIPNFEERSDDIVIQINEYSRLDVIALDLYGDPQLWWVLASYNNLPGDSLYTTDLTYLRIPADIQTVYSKIKELN